MKWVAQLFFVWSHQFYSYDPTLKTKNSFASTMEMVITQL